MGPARFISNQLASPISGQAASGQDDEPMEPGSHGQPAQKGKTTKAAQPPFLRRSPELFACHSGVDAPDVPMLQRRAVENQPPDSNVVSEIPKTLDLSAYRKASCYDFFAAELPKLTRESPVRKESCGLTFRCQTHSWGDTELALTFIGCDLGGKPKAINGIGVQLLDAYPADWQGTRKLADKKEFADSLLRCVVGHASYTDLKLRFESVDPSQHVLMLGALDEDTTFNIELQMTALFPDGLPVPPGAVPQELLAFVTTDNLVQGSWHGGNIVSTPSTEILHSAAFGQGAVLRGKNHKGELVGYFDTQARPRHSPRLQFRTERPPPDQLPLRSDYRNAVRLMVTPAIVFNAPLVKQSFGSRGTIYHEAPVVDEQTVHCPGLGNVRIKTVLPVGELRLLPSTVIDVVTTDPLAGIS